MSGIRLLSAGEVEEQGVEALGLDASALDLLTPEAIASMLRRAASFISPCTSRTLRETIVRGLEHLHDDPSELRTRIDAAMESLVGYGDLLDLPEANKESVGGLIHLAPPSFVWRPGVALLLGGLRDDVDMLPVGLRARIHYANHTRRIYEVTGEELRERLRRLELIDLPEAVWLRPPRPDSAQATVAAADRALEGCPTRGEVRGLTILDSGISVKYYPGRWRSAAKQSGHFIARREQKFGADLWCYVAMEEGQVVRLLDLPRVHVARAGWRGCDDAWNLQMALDDVAGHRQQYRLRSLPPTGFAIVDFLSPVPQWARRRWDVIGELIEPQAGLFAYRFSDIDFAREQSYMEDELWLTRTS
jgi:hypothetical protein